MLENSSATIFNSLLRLLIILLLLLPLIVFVVVVLISLLFDGCDLVSLLLHAVGLLAFAWARLGALSSNAAELFVALDQIIKRLIVHLVVHSYKEVVCVLSITVNFELIFVLAREKLEVIYQLNKGEDEGRSA